MIKGIVCIWVMRSCEFSQHSEHTVLTSFNCAIVFEEWILANSTMLRIHCFESNLLLSLPDNWISCDLTTECSQSDMMQMEENWILVLLHPSIFCHCSSCTFGLWKCCCLSQLSRTEGGVTQTASAPTPPNELLIKLHVGQSKIHFLAPHWWMVNWCLSASVLSFSYCIPNFETKIQVCSVWNGVTNIFPLTLLVFQTREPFLWKTLRSNTRPTFTPISINGLRICDPAMRWETNTLFLHRFTLIIYVKS